MAVSNTKKRFDSIYSASKPGKRKSSKFAKIVMRNGDVFRRRNANQYGNAVGNKTYTENRKNRTDKDIFLEQGGGVSDIEMGEGIEMASRGKQIYEEIYASPRKLLVKKMINKLGKDAIVIKSNGDTRKFSPSITKNNSKFYAIFPASVVYSETSLTEPNGDLLLFRNKFKTKAELLDKLNSVYGVSKFENGGSVSDVEMGEDIEMAKRGMSVASRNRLASALKKDIEGVYKADVNKSIDSKLRASKAGKRTSKKYARIQRKDGSYFRRRNANQFGEASGNKKYYEYRKNRTDKNVWLEEGGSLPTMGGFVYNIGGLI